MSNESNLPQAIFRFLFFAAGAGAEVGVVWSICGELKETETLWTNGTAGTEKPVIAKISDEMEGAGSLDAGGRHCGDAGRRRWFMGQDVKIHHPQHVPSREVPLASRLSAS